MATKRRVLGVNLNYDLQSESYRSIFAIMHFYDAQQSKIKNIQVSFVPLKWAIQPLQLMDYILLAFLLCSIAEYFYELCRILTSP